jgi:hypothetical protein
MLLRKDIHAAHERVSHLARKCLALGTSTLIDLAWISAVWVIAILMINPSGDFPLNDDWSYSHPVRTLIEDGDFRPMGFAVMPLLSHALWGFLFAAPVGFGYTALRVSMIVAGLLGLFGVYALCRDFRQPRSLCIVAALAVGVYPAYCLLSYTFMTDISFTAASVWSVVFFCRNLRSRSTRSLVAGTVLASCALLSRQVGLAMPAAFAVIAMLPSGTSCRRLTHALFPLAACIAILLAYNYWMEATGRMPAQYAEVVQSPLLHLFSLQYLFFLLSIYGYFAFIYIGLFLLPVFLFDAGNLFWSAEIRRLWLKNKRGTIALCVLGATAMLASAITLHRMDYPLVLPMLDRGNILGEVGMGPYLVRDWVVLHLPDHLQPIPLAFWVVITALGVVGAAALIFKLALHGADLVPKLLGKGRRVSDDELASMFLVLCCVIYLAPYVIYGFYDRYLILLLPLLAMACIGVSGRSIAPASDGKILGAASIALLTLWGVISISGTHDYLEFNRVRWQALRTLMQEYRVGPEEIDGGAEFNGLYLYDPEYSPDPIGLYTRSPHYVIRDTYQIGFGLLPGYVPMKEYSYFHLFPPHEQKVVVSRKAGT